MRKMDTKTVLAVAGSHLEHLRGRTLDLITISPPASPAAAVNLTKIVSKLSPIIGNLIEYNIVEFLNQQKEFSSSRSWRRQDPGFPDAIFDSGISPVPGFEIKAWFPLATEITARFKDSQNHFLDDQTNVVLLAWLPEHLIYGMPAVIDLCIVSAASVAAARDLHYHNPPDYLVVEPNDTSGRTSNLQQTNTNGYKFQGTKAEFAAAQKLVQSWGPSFRTYSPADEYQLRVHELMSKFPYRLDTNFAKTDRIAHPQIEAFKKRVLKTQVHGMSISQWARLFTKGDESTVEAVLREQIRIGW